MTRINNIYNTLVTSPIRGRGATDRLLERVSQNDVNGDIFV